jgi:hypothetical protein
VRRGEVAATTMEEERREAAIWGKMSKCRSRRRRGLYTTPTFCHGLYSQP